MAGSTDSGNIDFFFSLQARLYGTAAIEAAVVRSAATMRRRTIVHRMPRILSRA